MATPQEDVMKKMQGLKDSRGPVGQMARGNNMYPGGNAARTGGGPNIGRPPEAMQNAMNAVKQRMQQGNAGGNMPNANAAAPAQANAMDRMKKMQKMDKSKAAKLASTAMQAAAKRKMMSQKSAKQNDLASKMKQANQR